MGQQGHSQEAPVDPVLGSEARSSPGVKNAVGEAPDPGNGGGDGRLDEETAQGFHDRVVATHREYVEALDTSRQI